MKTTPITLAQLRATFAAVFDNEPEHAYPTVLPEWLYDRAEAEDFNMTGYVRRQMAPTETGIFVITHELPTSAQRREAIKDKIARGERLGASHNARMTYHGATTGRWTRPIYTATAEAYAKQQRKPNDR